MKIMPKILLLLFVVLNIVKGYSSEKNPLQKTETEVFRERHLVPIYAADTRAHRLGIQRDLQNPEFIGSMGGQFPVYSISLGKHIFQFELAGTTYLGLLRSVNHGSVLNTDFFVDAFLNYQWHPNWAIRLGTGHTSQHLSDDAIANGLYPFNNYARDYHQIGLSRKGFRRKYHLYANYIYNYNFKADRVLSGNSILQSGFECNLSQLILKKRKESGFIIGADFKFRSELDFRSTRNILFAYQFKHNEGQQIKLVFNYTSGADERGQFYQSNKRILSTGIHAEF